ncbi:DUF7144 family membrane protein [Gordonia sp. (in: high G+C Gram-positive bacteria)]|uniref:DUF7144 family membrane protein n=1 Tax=Gordonia sp. (in: high G+C Gram-positive bacteria) TaxID=84139 RepID=UPI003C79677D
MSSPDNRELSPVKQGIAGGATFAAAMLLFVGGILGVLQGISAVAKDELFVPTLNYVFSVDLTGWGWIHIIIGAIAIAIACGMIAGATWARVAAIVIASISIIANFLWLPYYPWWSILIIAIDVIIIWAVSTWRAA